MSKRPCHLCGSTNWPSPTTTCPLCFGEPEPEPDYDEDDDWSDFTDESEKIKDE